MPAKNSPITIYPDDNTKIQFEILREHFSQKQGGVKISDSFIGRALIHEKHTELIDKQNNRERITTLGQKIVELQALIETMQREFGVTLLSLANEIALLRGQLTKTEGGGEDV